jgi:hypothetical protein
MLKESMIVIVLLTILGYTLFAVAILRLHMFPIYGKFLFVPALNPQ